MTTPRFNDPGPKFQQPSYYGSPTSAPSHGNDRRKRSIPVSIERRIAPRRRDDRLDKAEG